MMFRRLLVLLFAFSLTGCSPVLIDIFPRDGRGDDDDDATNPQDDDDDVVGSSDPEVEILGLDPSTLPVTGTADVVIRVSDEDSSQYTLRLEFGTEGASSNWSAATVDNATTAPNEIFEDVGTEGFNVQTEATWASAIDIPVTSETTALRACVEDESGNDACDVWPDNGDLPVDNYTFNGGGSFCQPGDLEALNWVAGRAFVPLSDGTCLNYQANDPPQADDFSAQFLMVLVNPDANGVGFRISATSQPNFPEEGAPLPLNPAAAGASAWPNGLPEIAETNRIEIASGMARGTSNGARSTPTRQMAPASMGPTPFANTPGSQLPVITEQVAQAMAAKWTAQRNAPGEPAGFEPPLATCAPDLFPADVNFDARNFYLRNELESEDRITRAANLRALGDTIAIYVDEETPMDVDLDCSDPNNPIQPNPLPAFGFNNCDLEQIVDIVDDNIYPTLTSLYGEPSDVDQNCRVTVFLSHRLNSLTSDSEDEGADNVVRSLSEPNIDLWERNLTENPFSNEQEVLYIYAPDPVGFWGNPVQLDEYLNFEVAGRIAVTLQDLISYSRHRGVAKELFDPLDENDVSAPDAEADWLNDAMGLLAADMAGFGSIAFRDAWIYMDRSHLFGLLPDNEISDFEDRGGQYLFARYLFDLFGDVVISQIIDAETTGTDTIQALIGDVELTDFILQWATAMAVSGRTNEAGGLLVPDTVVPNYKVSTTVTVQDPENPVPGELFGANDFQQGFNVRGINRVYAGGTDPLGAVEQLDERVRTENLDTMVFHPQSDFFSGAQGEGGITLVLISGLEQPVNYLIVETEGGGELLGNVIRIEDTDPLEMALTLEDVDGAKITTVRELGDLLNNELDPTGYERRVIGRIDPSESFEVLVSATSPELGDDDDDDDATGDDDDSALGDDDDSALGDDDDSALGDDDDSAGPARGPVGDDDDSAEEEEVEIADTDRYSFSLTSTTTVGVWVDRRYSDLEGNAALEDPFLAVMPASDVPDAFNYLQWDFGPSFGVCPDPGTYIPGTSVFFYPLAMLDYIAAQANLSNDPVVGNGFDAIVGPGPNPLLDCTVDHDQDGVPDDGEASPINLAEQIAQRQAENLNDDPNFYVGTFDLLPGDLARDVSVPFFDETFIDLDSNEDPDDERATAAYAANVGGGVVEGEEAMWLGTLPPGDYIVVVGGANGAIGPYDLAVRVVPPTWLE
ncbi:MAG: hypothetical protein KDA24_01225 [Deltaproteobacteria bacterium]|nr:hypothetical protein [Deltaproteobacteria bacterium]